MNTEVTSASRARILFVGVIGLGIFVASFFLDVKPTAADDDTRIIISGSVVEVTSTTIKVINPMRDTVQSFLVNTTDAKITRNTFLSKMLFSKERSRPMRQPQATPRIGDLVQIIGDESAGAIIRADRIVINGNKRPL